MPRNSSGNYVLPSGNPVVADTLIESAWANLTMSDLAEALTDSLDRNGRGGMLAPFRLADGVLLEPGLSFANEPSLGLLRAGTNDMRATVLGVPRMRWTAAAGTENWDGSAWRTLAEGAYREVTETQTDATAGRLLKVGDFGVGSNAPPIVADDLNTIVQSGFYRVDGAAINKPGTGTLTGSLWVQVRIEDPARITQLWITAANSAAVDGQIFSRAARGSDATPIWSPWRRIYDTETILGTVSQVGGFPTGAIIERGSNANGEFVRFADGTQICTGIVNSSGSGITNWTFSAAFFTNNPLHVFGTGADTTAQTFMLVTLTASVAGWDVRNTSNARGSGVPTRLMAIGRWF